MIGDILATLTDDQNDDGPVSCMGSHLSDDVLGIPAWSLSALQTNKTYYVSHLPACYQIDWH